MITIVMLKGDDTKDNDDDDDNEVENIDDDIIADEANMVT